MKKKIFAILILLFLIVSLIVTFSKKEYESSKKEIDKNINSQRLIEVKVLIEEPEIDPIEEAVESMNREIDSISNIKNSDKELWFIEYKNIINKYSYILDPPESIYDYFTKDELNIFFSVVQAEVGDEYTFEQKCNVANVILNRIYHYQFEDNMFDVLTPSQFETVNNGRYKTVDVSYETVLACEYAFMFEDTTDGALFFDSNNVLKYEFIMNDGAHNFYKLRRKEFQQYAQKEN